MRSSSRRQHRADRGAGQGCTGGEGGRAKRSLLVAAGVLMLLSGTLPWLVESRLAAGQAPPQQGSATLSKEPPAPDLFIGGGDLIIAEKVEGIPEGTGLGAFSFTVLYSGRVVDISVSEGPFLSSTGRTTTCLSLPSENLERFGCVSVGHQRRPPGPTGSGVLAFITVRPKPGLVLRPTVGNGVIAVLDNLSKEAALSDPLGESIPVGKVLDAVVTVRALEADLNRDCVVDVVDEQIISYRYQATFGLLLYDPFFDLEPSVTPDGDIDIKDLQFVYGRDGTACKGVIPPTPTPTATATPFSTPTSTGTPATATPTPTPTSTGTPATATPTPRPTSTGTPATATPTPRPTSTGTPATATPTPRPTSTGTPATATPTPTPTSTGTPATGTPSPTPTSTGTPAAGTPTPSRTPAIAEGTPTPAAAPPTGTPVFAGTVVPAGVTPTPTPPFIAGVLPTAVTSPTVVVEALPLAGSGRPGSPPWTTIGGLALALGGVVLLYGGVRLRSRAASRPRTGRRP